MRLVLRGVQVEENRVPLQLVSLGPLISVKQPGPNDEIFSLFNEQSVRLSINTSSKAWDSAGN